MAVITSNASGLWSAGATWVGGVPPANGDSFVIASGHTVEFDVDQSAMATGMVGGTITGALTLTTTPGTYYLKMSGTSGHNITGAGTFNIGSSGSPHPNDVFFTCDMGASSSFNVANAQWYGEDWLTDTYCLISGATEAAGQTVLSVDRDLTADNWPDDGTGRVYISRATPSGGGNAGGGEYRTIASGGIASGTITITAGLTTQKEVGSMIVLLNRPIRLKLATASSVGVGPTADNEYIFSGVALDSGGTPGSGWYIRNGNDNRAVVTFKGQTVAAGGANLTYQVNRCIIEGNTIVCGFGSVYIPYLSTINTSQENYLFLRGNAILTGNTAVVNGNGQYPLVCYENFWIHNCRELTANPGNVVLRGGKVEYVTSMTSGFFGRIEARGTYLYAVNTGKNVKLIDCHCYNSFSMTLVSNQPGQLELRGCFLDVASPMLIVSDANRQAEGQGVNSFAPLSGIMAYDDASAFGVPQRGKHRAWCSGGTTTYVATASAPASPPADPGHFMVTTYDNAKFLAFFEERYWFKSGVPVTITVWCINSASGSWGQIPKVGVYDLDVRDYQDLATSVAETTMTDNTSWQTLTLSFTPSKDMRAMFRIFGARASGTTHWNYAVSPGAVSGRGIKTGGRM